MTNHCQLKTCGQRHDNFFLILRPRVIVGTMKLHTSEFRVGVGYELSQVSVSSFLAYLL